MSIVVTTETGDRYGLGRQPADPRTPKLRLYPDFEVTLTPPSSADWLSAVPGPWGMLKNDTVGDCTAAGALHYLMAQQWYGQQQPITFADTDAITMYSAISGYEPNTGANDNGATLQDGLN